MILEQTILPFLTLKDQLYDLLAPISDYATGKYKVKIQVSASGYENYPGSKTFKVTPIPVTFSRIFARVNSPLTLAALLMSVVDNSNMIRSTRHVLVSCPSFDDKMLFL